MPENGSQEHELEFRDEKKWEAGRNNDGVHESTYDSNKYISEAKRVPNGTVPMNILQFQYPFTKIEIEKYNFVKRSLDSFLSLFKSRKCSSLILR